MPPLRTFLVIASVATLTAFVLVTWQDYGWPELGFYTAVLATLGVVLHALVHAWRTQQRTAREAGEILRVGPTEAATVAVRHERARLNEDIATTLRRTLGAAAREAAQARTAADPALNARRIHRLTQEATSELRRALGLICAVEVTPVAAPDHESAPPTLTRRDLALGVGGLLLAGTEAVLYIAVEDLDRGLPAILGTALAGAAILGHRRWPAQSAVLVSALFLASGVVGQGLVAGLWILLSVVGLVWACIARSGAPVWAGLLLAGTCSGATWWTDPGNAGMTTTFLVVAVLVALVTRLVRERTRRTTARAASHALDVAAAEEIAIDAERRAFARDIHDSISHAVGVIALQSAAADIELQRDPAAGARSFDVIARTAQVAVAELDGLSAGPPSVRLQELGELLTRMENAGLALTRSGLESLPAEHLGLTYRFLQECLTNVLRHSTATRATVRVTRALGETVVQVADNGRANGSPGALGFGLVGLTERVGLAGGSLSIEPDGELGGYTVTATLPDAEAVA